MRNIIDKIKNAIKKIDFKSKKTWLFIGFFLVLLISGSILMSYGYYIKAGNKNLIVSGSASLSSSPDISLQIYLEDRDNNGDGTGNYSRIYYIPRQYYTYNSSSSYCSTGLTITSYDSTNYNFNISSTQKGFCKVYFDAVDGYIANTNFHLYVEQRQGRGDYKQMAIIPDNNYIYEINSTNTSCTDQNAQVSIVSRKIKVVSSSNVTCDIYLDINTVLSENSLGNIIMYLEGQTFKDSDNNDWAVVDENGYRFEGANPNNYVILPYTYTQDLYSVHLTEINGDATDEYLYEISPYFWYTTASDCETAISSLNTVTCTCEKVFASGDPVKFRIIGIFTTEYYENGEISEAPLIKIVSPYTVYTGLYNLTSFSNAIQQYLSYTDFSLASAYNVKTYIASPSDYINATASDWFIGEKNGVYNTSTYNSNYFVNYISSIYPSDFGYAALNADCARTVALTNAGYNDNYTCISKNWLTKKFTDFSLTEINDSSQTFNFYGTVTPSQTTNGNSFTVGNKGIKDVSEGANFDFTTFINPNLTVTGGNGTKDNPYVVSFN